MFYVQSTPFAQIGRNASLCAAALGLQAGRAGLSFVAGKQEMAVIGNVSHKEFSAPLNSEESNQSKQYPGSHRRSRTVNVSD